MFIYRAVLFDQPCQMLTSQVLFVQNTMIMVLGNNELKFHDRMCEYFVPSMVGFWSKKLTPMDRLKPQIFLCETRVAPGD